MTKEISQSHKSNNKEKGPSQTAPAAYKGKNYAFLDAEYLSARFKRKSIEDVISIGMIITNPKYEEMDRFYSTVRLTEGHRLPPLITELTGLTNEELEEAPYYEDVMTDIINMVKRYQVGQVFVWGGDKSNFQRDFEARTLEKPLKRAVSKFISTIVNIQKDISYDITDGIDSGLSLADLKTLCGLDNYVSHNALNDAQDMLDCIRIIENGGMVYDGVEAAKYKKFRGEYVKNRSFDDLEEDGQYIIKSSAGVRFLKELQRKDFGTDPKTKAFMDDLEFILGKGNAYMGTFSEMMNAKEE
ncbi:MAG: 3'-5' exonuclease [Pseudobutyrivibrio sp.]|nr:3'-5' exonuclease [Pseudobutyrivibrio sp.]